jgi:hypothetical protein
MNLALRMELGFLGVDDAEAAMIENAEPAGERLDDAAEELEPIIERIWPDVLKIAAIVQARYPDAKTVLPVIRALLQKMKGT